MIVITLVVSHACSWKGDRIISVMKVEHREGNTDKPSRIEGKHLGAKPTFYYELVCEPSAVHLEVGRQYKAQTRGTKTVLIFLNMTDGPTSSGLEGIECEVKSGRTTAG